MSLPTFAKLGTKLSTPSWMSSGGDELMFPRIFDNDAVRASLASLPASSYSVLFGTDHGSGKIGRADFDSIEGTWTDSGSAIHTGGSQRETPHPIYDAANNRVNVYVHDNSSTVTNGQQATRLLTTTDLATLTDQGEVMPYGHHTGYAQAEYRNSQFEAWHLLIGGEGSLNAYSTSADGETFSLDRTRHPGQMHIAGTGNVLQGVATIFQYGGDWYGLAALSPRPRLSSTRSAIVAVPLDSTTWRPTGGYYTLIEPGSSGADDEVLTNYYGVAEIGGTLYIMYIGTDSSGGNHILLAKEDGGSSTQTSPQWSINSDGTLARHTNEAGISQSWDAANDPLPSWLEIDVQSGSNNSSQSAGNYYEIKTGSTTNEDVFFKTTSTYDVTAYETIEFVLRGLTLKDVDLSNLVQWGFRDAFSPSNCEFVHWQDSDPERYSGQRFSFASGTRTESGMYILPYSDPGSEHPWTRAHEFDLTFRVHDYGRRLSVLVDGDVAYHADISGDQSWPSQVFGHVRLRGLTGVEVWARVTSVELNAYTIAAPTSPSASGGASSITLNWTDPAGVNLSKIDVYRSTTSGSGYTKISGAGGVAIGTETYEDTTASEGTTYYYVLKAVDDEAEESADSTEVSAAAGAVAAADAIAIRNRIQPGRRRPYHLLGRR